MSELSAESERRFASMTVSETTPLDLSRQNTPELIPAAGPVDEQHRLSALDSLRVRPPAIGSKSRNRKQRFRL